jgi:hypothetical protein
MTYIIKTGNIHSSVYAKRSTWFATLSALCAVVWNVYVIALVIPTRHKLPARISVLLTRCWNKFLLFSSGESRKTIGDIFFAVRKVRSRKKELIDSTIAIDTK